MLARMLTRLIDAQQGWSAPLGGFLQRLFAAIFRPVRPIKDFLNGTWLGHPVHSALTDLPIGILTLVLVFDVLDLRQAADVSLLLGILAMTASAVAGVADYVDTAGVTRNRATVHSSLMVVGLVVLLVSLVLRLGGPADRIVPVLLDFVGYGIVTAGAYVGGEVVYMLGNMVNRHAWRSGGERWQALDVAEIPEGVPTRAKAGAQTLVLVRQGETILALHDTCAHAGGPLSQGRLVGDSIECPWHQSRYRLSDGHRTQGPTTFDQPAYEVRPTDAGGWEARRTG
jgi:nitrite reductase/ring-hydroxylating ferredoxin subunit/uncharacterized membrane protein